MTVEIKIKISESFDNYDADDDILDNNNDLSNNYNEIKFCIQFFIITTFFLQN